VRNDHGLKVLNIDGPFGDVEEELGDNWKKCVSLGSPPQHPCVYSTIRAQQAGKFTDIQARGTNKCGSENIAGLSMHPLYVVVRDITATSCKTETPLVRCARAGGDSGERGAGMKWALVCGKVAGAKYVHGVGNWTGWKGRRLQDHARCAPFAEEVQQLWYSCACHPAVDINTSPGSVCCAV
jgi:hypothetical protein